MDTAPGGVEDEPAALVQRPQRRAGLGDDVEARHLHQTANDVTLWHDPTQRDLPMEHVHEERPVPTSRSAVRCLMRSPQAIEPDPGAEDGKVPDRGEAGEVRGAAGEVARVDGSLAGGQRGHPVDVESCPVGEIYRTVPRQGWRVSSGNDELGKRHRTTCHRQLDCPLTAIPPLEPPCLSLEPLSQLTGGVRVPRRRV